MTEAPLGEVIVNKNGFSGTNRKYFSRPQSDNSQSVEGWTGKEYSEDSNAIRPILVITSAGEVVIKSDIVSIKREM